MVLVKRIRISLKLVAFLAVLVTTSLWAKDVKLIRCGEVLSSIGSLERPVPSWPVLGHDRREDGRRPVSTSEHSILVDFYDRIYPFFMKKGVAGFVEGKDGMPIRYRKFEVPNEKGAVVLVHGFSENFTKYPELVYNLVENGYSVYLMDHRGHGESGRLVDNILKVHTRNFQDYVDDVHAVMEKVVKQKPHQNVTMLGHSMGGLISTYYAHQHPENIDRLVLSAPMMKINLGLFPEMIANGVANTLSFFGLSRKYAFGNSDRFAYTNFENNHSTTSRPRYLLRRKQVEGNLSNAGMSGASFGWVASAIPASIKGRHLGGELKVPLLVMQGEDDRVVRNTAIERFCSRVPDCQRVMFPTARHDLYLERDEIRDQLMNQLFDFMESERSVQK